MENPVIIFGASGLGKSAMEIFNSHDVIVYCFLDDDESLHGTEINEVSVMGNTWDDGFLKYIGKKCEAFVAIEDSEERNKIVEMLKERRKVMPVNAVHNKAILSEFAQLGHGNLVNAGATVNSGVEMGNHCIVHSNALLEYDTQVEDFAQIGSGAIVGAKCSIGSEAIIGTGAVISPGIKIGKRAQVVPGSVVLQDVGEGETVFGVPAKPVG